MIHKSQAPDSKMSMTTPIRNLHQLLQPFDIEAPEIELQDLVLDSREVAIHKGFLAVAGHDLDGRDFIPQAISLGARVIIADTEEAEQHGQMDMREHSLIVKFYQLQANVSSLASVFFDAPSEKLSTIAVTGTNGKTSTVHFCCQLANLLNEPAWYVGTLGFGLLHDLQETKNTTPDPVSMQRLAWHSLQKECTNFVFEASSHALVQNRIANINTNIAIFTNLTRDHLDYHGTMENYADAKRLLLRQPGLNTAILNVNDAEHQNWLHAMPAGVNTLLIGVSDTATEKYQYCFARDIEYTNSGIQFCLHSTWGENRVNLPLFGEFNIHNVLSAVAVQLSLGHSFADVVTVLRDIEPVAGRAEFFRQPDKADIVVDYAHTPDALKLLLRSLRPHCKGRLVSVFGCGGDRDQGKRPQMGNVAETYSDFIVLTNDNVRSEDPEEIIRQIKDGIEDHQHVYVETDRMEAIQWAFENSHADDLIVVAGKGHETSQIIGKDVTHYDEREFIKTIIKQAQRKVSL